MKTLRTAQPMKITKEYKDGHHHFDISDESGVLAKVNCRGEITFFAGRASGNWYVGNSVISPAEWKAMSRLINRAIKQCGNLPDEGCNCP